MSAQTPICSPSETVTPLCSRNSLGFLSSVKMNRLVSSIFSPLLKPHLASKTSAVHRMSAKSYVHTLAATAPYTVLPIPALSDNYMYLIVDPATKYCAAIDCVDPKQIMSTVEANGLKISHVLTTHSHWDHAGGNNAMAKLLGPSIPIVGGVNDQAEGVSKEVSQGDVIEVGNLKINVLSTPFHTSGHVCYYVEGNSVGNESFPGSVFTGDTLFIGGCGNLNDGTKEQLFQAFDKLGKLPRDTLVWVGHEYTISNLKYALTVEPKNEALLKKYRWVVERTRGKNPTIPSTIQEEHETSPFMRAAFGASKEVDQMAGISSNEELDRVKKILWVRQDKSGPAWKGRWEKLAIE